MNNLDDGKKITSRRSIQSLDAGKHIIAEESLALSASVKSTPLFDRMGDGYKGWRVNVVSWSDVDKNTRECWGDHWVKVQMEDELVKLGCVVNNKLKETDISIYLFGSPFPFKGEAGVASYNPYSYNVLWFYSHPDKMNSVEANRYDHIFCLSKLFIPKVSAYHRLVELEPLYSCTNFKPPVDSNAGAYDVVMVANARGALAPYGREVVQWMVDGNIKCRVNIWGTKWEQHDKYNIVPRIWYSGKYYPYSQLNTLYRSSKIVLIDGHGDMEVEGFVPMKLYDVFASGGFPLIRSNVGIVGQFGSSIADSIQFSDQYELKNKIEYFIGHPEKSRGITEEGMRIVFGSDNTYRNRVLRILDRVRDRVLHVDRSRMESANITTHGYIYSENNSVKNNHKTVIEL